MKIAAISDIHSNLPALEAVLEDIEKLGCDRLIVAGDFINCGPWPVETMRLIKKYQPVIIRGNHEAYVLDQARGRASQEPPNRALLAPSRWTAAQLSAEDHNWLENLPERVELSGPDGAEILAVHGSPRRVSESINSGLSEAQKAEIFAGEIRPRRLIISGHTHLPFIQLWQNMLITNCGSVGAPIDGDARACYLVAEWDGEWRAEHRRVTYNLKSTLEALERNASYDEGGPFMKLIKRNTETGLCCGLIEFGVYYRKLVSYPKPPHDFDHLDEAVIRYLEQR